MTPVPAVAVPHPSISPHVVVRSHASAPTGWRPYTVVWGDTIVGLAQRSGTTPVTLATRNHLRDGGRRIVAGQVLLVPAAGQPATGQLATAARAAGSGSATAPATATQPVLTSAGKPTVVSATAYTVRRGDTLEGIAARTKATQVSIVKANTLAAPYLLQVGQVLQVPQPAPPATTATFAGRTYPQATLDAAAANRAALASAKVPSRDATRALVAVTATRHGVDPTLALAVSYLESGWNQRLVSVANAIGTMQVIPSSGAWASGLAGRRLDLLRTEDNVTAGVVILRALLRSAGSLDEAIAGYYQGLASVRAHGMYPDTASYVATVKGLQARMSIQ